MSEPNVPPAETPAPDTPAPTPLDQAPLGEYVARRGKGETPAAPPVPPKEPTPDEGDEGDELPLEEPPKDGKPIGSTKAKNFKQRFDQVYRQRSEAMRDLDAERARVTQLQNELAELRQKAPQKETPSLPAEVKPPNLDEYLAAGKTYEDWLDARDEFRYQTRYRQEFAQMLQQREQQYQQQQQMAGFAERSDAAKAKYADYDAVVVQNDRVQLSPVMQDIARRSPHGPDIMYWLGTHEAEANQLGQMTANYPPAAFPLVEQHLLLLSGQQHSNGQTGAKKAVPVSQAPTPITPVGGGSTTSTVQLDQMSLGEFVKRRNADIEKKRTG